jgi:lipopolysaccharide/colanic/teichoic acid biosynthesis glycosyltransferase
MVKAGLTGWAQINYPYGASVDDARSKLGYDLYYVKNFSILFDLVILLQTLRMVLWPSGMRQIRDHMTDALPTCRRARSCS